MKILHVSTGFPLSYPGGITNYVRALAKIQANMGDEVHVLARPEKQALRTDKVRLASYVPSHVTPFSLEIVEEDPTSSKIVDLLHKERFDIVHFHMALDLPLRLLRDFSSFGVPYVVSLHDYFYICPRIFMIDAATDICREVDIQKCRSCVGRLDQVNLLRRAARKLAITLPRVPSFGAERRMETMKAFLQNAALLLPVSTRTAEIYRRIVPDGHFEVEQIGNESADTEPVARTKSDKIRLTALGTLNKPKGAVVLEELIRRVRRPDIEFHFHGRAFDGYDKRLQSLGLVCHGSYVPKDLPSIIAKTDVGLVLPIWEDNGPQVAMEFINNLVPVLGTRRGGVPELVAEGAGFLFDPDDHLDIERAVAWIEDLNKEKIEDISLHMQRLKTPAEHAARIAVLYHQTLGDASAVGHRE
jgi:glycosyltransferase involved in cell wall biosynthesis